MSNQSSLNGDIAIAVAAIAAELGLDVDVVRVRATGILRSFSAAHYNAGVRDTMVRFGSRSPGANEPVPSSSEATPVVGPHGRRTRKSINLSRRPTPMIPPPHGVPDEDDIGKR